MTRVLFVCVGNIGRSQMAEAFYNQFSKTKDASSAGLSQSTPVKYPCLPDEIIEPMKEEGIDVSDHKVKTLTKNMIWKSDKVFVLCRKDLCPDYLLNSKKVVFWDIEDPYMKSSEGIRVIRDTIKEKIISSI